MALEICLEDVLQSGDPSHAAGVLFVCRFVHYKCPCWLDQRTAQSLFSHFVC